MLYAKDYPVIDDTSKYAFAGARLALMEKELLTQSDFEQFKMCATVQDFAKMLSDTVYAGLLESGDTIDQMIEMETIRFRNELYEIMPEADHWLLDTFFRKYDYNNLKICLKTHLTGREIPVNDLSRAGVMPPEELAEYFSEEKKGWLPFPINYEGIKESYRKEKELRLIDAEVDRAYYRELLGAIRTLGDPSMSDFMAQWIDLKNIMIFTRCKMTGLPMSMFLLEGGYIEDEAYEKFDAEPNIDVAFTSPDFQIYLSVYRKGLESLEKTGSYAELDTAVRNYFINLLTGVQDCFFSIKPFLGYLLAKEHEISLIKKFYIHIHNHIPFGKESDLAYYG